MRWSHLLVSVVFGLTMPLQANAARIDAKERAAKKACLTGETAKGVAILADLYIDTDDPTYLYNQGRCFEQNSLYKEAIAKFREYLRKARRANPTDRADAERHIAECKALVGENDNEPEAKEAAPVTPEPPKATEQADAEAKPAEPTAETSSVAAEPAKQAPAPSEPAATMTEVTEKAEPPASSPGGSGLRIAGIVVLASGAAALAAGVVMNLKYNGMIDDLQRDYYPDRESSSEKYQTLGWAGYGVGAACIAGGAVLYYLGWQAGRVSVAPAPMAGGGGILVGGAL